MTKYMPVRGGITLSLVSGMGPILEKCLTANHPISQWPTTFYSLFWFSSLFSNFGPYTRHAFSITPNPNHPSQLYDCSSNCFELSEYPQSSWTRLLPEWYLQQLPESHFSLYRGVPAQENQHRFRPTSATTYSVDSSIVMQNRVSPALPKSLQFQSQAPKSAVPPTEQPLSPVGTDQREVCMMWAHRYPPYPRFGCILTKLQPNRRTFQNRHSVVQSGRRYTRRPTLISCKPLGTFKVRQYQQSTDT